MSNHSYKGDNKTAPYIVHILEKLDENERAAHGALGASLTSKRKQRKNERMLNLRTVFFYGLNNSIRICRGHAHKLNTSPSPDEFFDKVRC